MLLTQKVTQKSVITLNKTKRSWTLTEQENFKHLYKQFKRDFKLYVPYFDGRTENQIKSFYQNVMHKNKMIQSSRNEPLVNVQQNSSKEVVHNEFSVSNSQFELTMITFNDLDDSQ
ncbi:Conserved_hypothetical protein [Hexamita inflata]|uniref:HTH myb-type domain-containing protein n=1 Tax=Hexamita inflata TaxID=28002 RepID=A0AA86NS04_9EUKA|nr:Conserved hypothetical protein [Hexamita inflata]